MVFPSLGNLYTYTNDAILGILYAFTEIWKGKLTF